jgi:hypothetical protein
MVADPPAELLNQWLTCGFLHCRTMPGMPGAVLSCPADTGKHRLTTAGCAEYVPKTRNARFACRMMAALGRGVSSVERTARVDRPDRSR